MLSKYLGQGKLYELLLGVFRDFEEYNVKHTMNIINSMATIKNINEVLSDIKAIW